MCFNQSVPREGRWCWRAFCIPVLCAHSSQGRGKGGWEWAKARGFCNNTAAILPLCCHPHDSSMQDRVRGYFKSHRATEVRALVPAFWHHHAGRGSVWGWDRAPLYRGCWNKLWPILGCWEVGMGMQPLHHFELLTAHFSPQQFLSLKSQPKPPWSYQAPDIWIFAFRLQVSAQWIEAAF